MGRLAKGTLIPIPDPKPPDQNESVTEGSPWRLLKEPLFRSLWWATLISNVGTWMQNVGAAWLMTSLTVSPLMIALVQAATSLPVFLVALPAGALADLVERRRFLVLTQVWMLAAAAILGLLAALNSVTPWTLIALTFALGLGAAMNTPAWQATIPEIAPKSELKNAITLNGVSINIARAVGPALGGIVIAASGVGTVFLLNAVSFVAVVVALLRWKRLPKISPAFPERFFGAMRGGIRYVAHAPLLQAVLIRAAVFTMGASGLWALLPVRVKMLDLGAGGYGFLLGCLGAGASGGVFLLPRARRAFSPDALAAAATLTFSLCTLALALAENVVLLAAAMFAAGIAWITLMSVLNAAAQTAVPDWVKGRALSFYLLAFQGGLAAGSAAWGGLASQAGTEVSLGAAATFLVIGLVAAPRYRIGAAEGLDQTPTLHWPAPEIVVAPRPDDGPVQVSVEYRIDPDRSDEFVAELQELRRVRLRDGAMTWAVYRDTSDPTRYVETFLVDSWSEHMRQHERITTEDRKIEDAVRAFQVADSPPRVQHLIASAMSRARKTGT